MRSHLWLLIVTLVAHSAKGAEYTFTQSNWSTLDPGALAAHPSNQSGWGLYSSKWTGVDAGVSVSLGAIAGAVRFTTDSDFLDGGLTNLTIRGTGTTAALALTATGDFGSGKDGDLVVDGQPTGSGYVNRSSDGQAHPCTSPYLVDQRPDFSVKEFRNVTVINGGCISATNAQQLTPPTPSADATAGVGPIPGGTYYVTVHGPPRAAAS